jgi:hypothetical protein
MSEDAAKLEVLIQIREELNGLRRTQQGLRETTQEAQGLGAALKQGLGIGSGFAIAAGGIGLLATTLKQAAMAALAYGGEIAENSRNLDMSRRGYQALRDLVRNTGGDISALTASISAQNQALDEARNVSSKAAAAFRSLDLNPALLEGMPVERRYERIAQAVASATDKQAAWAAAAEILGSRNIRHLRTALQELAEQGFDAVADSAASMVSDDAVAGLHGFTETLKRNWDIFVSKMADDSGTLLNKLGYSSGADPVPAEDRARAAAASRAKTWQDQRTMLAQLQQQLEATRAAQAAFESDPSLTNAERDFVTVQLLGSQVALLERIKWLRENAKGMPLDLRAGETPESRAAEVEQLRLEIIRLKNESAGKSGVRPSAFRRIREQYEGLENPAQNPDYMTAAEGMKAGAMQFVTNLGSTGQQVANILNSTLGATLSSLTADIWSAMRGTQGWGEAFKNVGNIAGQMLVQMIIQMTLVKSLQTALGWMGITMAAAPGAGAAAAPSIVAAGGGSFLTKGPTNLTVGDNPGGVELVNVIPLSGIGQTSVRGNVAKFAGGGSLLAGAGLGGFGAAQPSVVNVAFNFATGVAATVRAEVMAMAPELRSMAVDAVAEAHQRNQLRLA